MDFKKLKERFLGAVVTIITALVCFYFGSFATNSKVDSIAQDLSNFKADVESNYPKKVELQVVIGKIDSLRTALCIMDARTCPQER